MRNPVAWAGVLLTVCILGWYFVSHADGPVFVFVGGPLVSGERVEFASVDWSALNRLHELELEIVGTSRSRTLWFSVHAGAPYVGCDLDCVGGWLTRWPAEVEHDQRIVIRIDAKRIEGKLIPVPHGTPEYEAARASRTRKYSRDKSGRIGAEAAAHDAAVGVGKRLTGRTQSGEPGDRLYRVEPR